MIRSTNALYEGRCAFCMHILGDHGQLQPAFHDV